MLFRQPMIRDCFHCEPTSEDPSDRPKVIRFGSFYRRSDSRFIQRFKCTECSRTFSHATFSAAYRQKKRQFNHTLRGILCGGFSQNRAAKVLGLNRKTIARKVIYLGELGALEIEGLNKMLPRAAVLEFDDLETIEHTKCKPLAVSVGVEYKTRRIVDLAVARMPAKGRLAKKAREKYGPRKDERKEARRELFTRLQTAVLPNALIKSDMSSHYTHDIRKYFPNAEHKVFKGRKACVVGQGELKKGGFDPIFSLNHTFAMFRDNLKCLVRKNWCTTKKPEMLVHRLMMYAAYHNTELIKRPAG